MIQESEKYEKILSILKKSKPILKSTEDIEKEVIHRISGTQRTDFVLSDVIDFMFGWVYISWVRRSLIMASVVLVLIFVYQQGIILKQINFLSRQTILIDGETDSNPADEIEKKLIIYKLQSHRFPSNSIKISEKQMEQFLESVNELQVKYKDLLNLIEEDPELKKLIEKKMIESNRTKNKL